MKPADHPWGRLEVVASQNSAEARHLKMKNLSSSCQNHPVIMLSYINLYHFANLYKDFHRIDSFCTLICWYGWFMLIYQCLLYLYMTNSCNSYPLMWPWRLSYHMSSCDVFRIGASINGGGTPKIDGSFRGKPHENTWFGGILGNHHSHPPLGHLQLPCFRSSQRIRKKPSTTAVLLRSRATFLDGRWRWFNAWHKSRIPRSQHVLTMIDNVCIYI